MNRSESQILIALAGGGTGGHLYPLFSVADEIRRRKAVRLAFFATERAIDERLIHHGMADHDFVLHRQPVKPLPSSVREFSGFIKSWRAARRTCRAAMQEQRPCVLIGSGGFGSGPPVCTAKQMGIPVILLNPDAVPGKANRFLAPKSNCVALQWATSKDQFPPRVRTRVVGCPIRQSFTTASRADGVERFDLSPAKKTLLITGASQGARTINHAMISAMDAFTVLKDWQFLHLAGSADVETVRAEYQRHSLPATVLDYTEEMAEALAAADLVVSRAGASTLAEITAVGVPSVLMPYPHHRDNHQTLNANVLVKAGAAVIVPDQKNADATAKNLRTVLARLMSEKNEWELMKQRSADIARPDAAVIVAEMAMSLGGIVKYAAA